jgi:hypothetical protein
MKANLFRFRSNEWVSHTSQTASTAEAVITPPQFLEHLLLVKTRSLWNVSLFDRHDENGLSSRMRRASEL